MKGTNSTSAGVLRRATEVHRGKGEPHSWRLLALSLLCSAFFLLIFLLWKLQVEVTIVGVFQELLTLPVMAAQVVLLVVIVTKMFSHKHRTTANLLALILSLVTSILIIQSFL